MLLENIDPSELKACITFEKFVYSTLQQSGNCVCHNTRGIYIYKLYVNSILNFLLREVS